MHGSGSQAPEGWVFKLKTKSSKGLACRGVEGLGFRVGAIRA